MSRRVPLWVEPYAGGLAVGLRLLGGRALVGWQGSKARYADAIMQVLGVDGADEVWCADVSDWAQVWRALAKPGVAREAADLLDDIEARARAIGDHPAAYRQVWMGLRDDWRSKGTPPDARGLARWLALVKGSACTAGPDNGPKWPDLQEWRRHPRGGFAAVRIGTVTPDRLRALPDPLPIRTWDDARAIPTRRDAVVLLDPPYAGTTGYARRASEDATARGYADEVADRWRRRGAVVAMCETTSAGGVAYDLTAREVLTTGARMAGKNGKRTTEVLTVYGPPTTHPTLWDAPSG